MKINKIIYWTSPLLALPIYTSIIYIFLFLKEGGEDLNYIFTLFYIVVAPFIAIFGYIITYLYQRMKYRQIVLGITLLLFLSLEIIPDIKGCFVYDFTQRGAILTFIIGVLEGILIRSSYSFFLVILLYWSSKKERQKIKQQQLNTKL